MALDASEVLAGNGSTELLYLLPAGAQGGRAPSFLCRPTAITRALPNWRAAASSPCRCAKPAASPWTCPRLRRACARGRARETRWSSSASPTTRQAARIAAESLRELARRHPATAFVVDEAFADFVEGYDSLTARRPANVVVLLSLTKIFAVPGLRVGCAVASPEVVRRVQALQQPWTVNTLAQAVGVRALQDREYLDADAGLRARAAPAAAAGARALPGLTVYPSDANFLLVRLDARGSGCARAGQAPAARRHRDSRLRQLRGPGRPLLPRGGAQRRRQRAPLRGAGAARWLPLPPQGREDGH